jgi:uncharacterized protein (TIGR03118 family)
MSIKNNAKESAIIKEPIFLESNIKKVAKFTDKNLINPWGLAIKKDIIYVANNGSSTITRYDLKGREVDEPIIVSSQNPTSLVINKGNGFRICCKNHSLPSKIIVVTENGTIDGFNKNINHKETITLLQQPGKVFKGATLSKNNEFLFVTNFRDGFVEKYDQSLNLVEAFTDHSLKNVGNGYAPFGIELIEDYLFVTFAEYKDAEKTDDQSGIGNGFIDVFDQNGKLFQRFANRGLLNSPWGLLKYQNKLLVGNFGDGKILSYDICTKKFIGTIKYKTAPNDSIVLDGLWSIILNCDKIYFTAGIQDEAAGLLGILI